MRRVNRKNYFTGGSFGGASRFAIGVTNNKKFYTSSSPKYVNEYTIHSDNNIIENFGNCNETNYYMIIVVILLLIIISFN